VKIKTKLPFSPEPYTVFEESKVKGKHISDQDTDTRNPQSHGCSQEHKVGLDRRAVRTQKAPNKATRSILLLYLTDTFAIEPACETRQR